MDEPRDHQPDPPACPVFPPARRLVDLRRERHGDEELRSVLGRAALEVAGKHGYAGLTVDGILELSGASRPVFYRLFGDREECYQHGYLELAQILVENLLQECTGSSSWRDGVSAALRRFDAFIHAEPDLAAGLIGQVRAAAGEAIVEHDRLAAKLAAGLDHAAREAPEVSPPPRASEFILAAIESTAISALARREPAEFTASIDDLTFITNTTLLGEGPFR
jgi:AcrR family transcriptional regulator